MLNRHITDMCYSPLRVLIFIFLSRSTPPWPFSEIWIQGRVKTTDPRCVLPSQQETRSLTGLHLKQQQINNLVRKNRWVKTHLQEKTRICLRTQSI